MIKLGIIGYGYWGPNLVRNYSQHPGSEVVCVADRESARLTSVQEAYPAVRVTQSAQDLIDDPAVEAVIIATPVSSHFDLAMAALKAGKHVLVEKPITQTAAQAEQLIAEAEHRNLILMVDHTFIYTGAVRKMRELVDAPDFGDLRYYDSTRVNLGLFQHDVNVLWDLAVHDLSIMSYLMQAKPRAVSATGQRLQPDMPEYAAFLTVYFDSVIAHINVNWLSPVKVRRTMVGGSSQMVVYDDLEVSEKVRLYDRGIVTTETPDDVRKLLISYRTGDVSIPKLDEGEALNVEATHFLDCIATGKQPLTDGHAGLELVRILEAADRSLAARGAPIEL